jgi:pSer/pThr/pTyr-binding forkhead associated (FHA) protein
VRNGAFQHANEGDETRTRNLRIIDPKVSRKHFQIRKAEDHYTVVEFKSVNGVLVNGDRISGEHALADGDQIKVGDTTLIFTEADNAEATDALQKYKIVSRESREDRTLMD